MRGDGDLGQGSSNGLGDSWLVSGIVSSLEQAGFPRGVRKRGESGMACWSTRMKLWVGQLWGGRSGIGLRT